MSAVTFYRHGPIVRLAGPDGRPPSPTVCNIVESSLVYTHKTYTRGQDSYDPTTGRYSAYRFDRKTLYSYQQGHPVFQRGFERRIWDRCVEAGIEPTYVDLTPPHPRPDRFEFRPERVFERFSLLARQDECLAAIAANQYGQIWASVGFGKGYEIAAIALAYPNAKVLATTYRLDVINTLQQRLTQFLPDVGRVDGSQQHWARVTLCSADSLGKVNHDIAHEPDIFLYDEVHEAPTTSRLEQLARFMYSRNYGFTGSENVRADNADFRLEGYFGPCIFHVPFEEAQKLGLVLPIDVWTIPVNMSVNPGAGKSDTAKERACVWRNQTRNTLVAEAARLFDQDEQSLVLVKSVEHAFFLKKKLPEYKLVYGSITPDQYLQYIDWGLTTPEAEPIMTPQIRRQMVKQFEAGAIKKVICTDVWSTGVSFNQLAGMVRADARAAKGISMQAPGRVCRRHDASGKRAGLLIDFDDVFDPGMYRRSRERFAVYRGMGWTITKTNLAEAATLRKTGQPSVATPT